MIAREPIYSALFGLLSGAATFQTASRRLLHWADVNPAQQPSLFVVQKGETAVTRSTSLPAIFEMHVDIYIYAFQPDMTKAPSSSLNPLVDAVLAAIQSPGPGQEQTLGGLVTTCQVQGDIVYDEGVLGNQALAIIPLRILVAGP